MEAKTDAAPSTENKKNGSSAEGAEAPKESAPGGSAASANVNDPSGSGKPLSLMEQLRAAQARRKRGIFEIFGVFAINDTLFGMIDF